MQKPFDILAKEFADIANKLVTSQDKMERKELLVAMRLVLSEADVLTLSQLKGYPIPGAENK